MRICLLVVPVGADRLWQDLTGRPPRLQKLCETRAWCQEKCLSSRCFDDWMVWTCWKVERSLNVQSKVGIMMNNVYGENVGTCFCWYPDLEISPSYATPGVWLYHPRGGTDRCLTGAGGRCQGASKDLTSEDVSMYRFGSLKPKNTKNMEKSWCNKSIDWGQPKLFCWPKEFKPSWEVMLNTTLDLEIMTDDQNHEEKRWLSQTMTTSGIKRLLLSTTEMPAPDQTDSSGCEEGELPKSESSDRHRSWACEGPTKVLVVSGIFVHSCSTRVVAQKIILKPFYFVGVLKHLWFSTQLFFDHSEISQQPGLPQDLQRRKRREAHEKEMENLKDGLRHQAAPPTSWFIEPVRLGETTMFSTWVLGSLWFLGWFQQ